MTSAPVEGPTAERSPNGGLARFGPTTPKQFGAKHQTNPYLAVHVPPDSTLEMGAAEMGAAIRCSLAGDFR